MQFSPTLELVYSKSAIATALANNKTNEGDSTAISHEACSVGKTAPHTPTLTNETNCAHIGALQDASLGKPALQRWDDCSNDK